MASRATDQRSGRAEPQLGVTLVGGPTAVLEYGGLRWPTDPSGNGLRDRLLVLERGQRAEV